MTTRKSYTGRATSTARGLLSGLAVNMLITLAAAAILAKLIDDGIMTWENVGYAILITIMLSSFAGAYTSCQRIKRQKLVVSLLSGFIYWATLIGLNALVYSGKYEAVAVTTIIILAGSLCAFLLTIPKSSHSKQRKYKTRTR